MDRHIFLVGMPGSGKTTVGQLLAQALERPLCDMDEEIKMADFGRRGILNLRQNLQGRIADIEKGNLYNSYKNRVGEMIVGEVYQAWKKEVLVMDEDGNELYLPKQNKIPTDYYRKGDTVRAVVVQVDNKNQNPKIIL